MTLIAATMESFFVERLAQQKRASPDTIAAYRDTMRLLLGFVHDKTGTPPAKLDWGQLDAVMITGFLDYLESDRGNTVRTRNMRLTAIRSLFSYASLRHPEHAATISHVLAIPTKRYEKATITFLDPVETKALIGAPDPDTWEGKRDQVFIATAIQTGLRLSELLNLTGADVTTRVGPNVRCLGKGRKYRAVPLSPPIAKMLDAWIKHNRIGADQPVFATRNGRRLSPDAIQRRLNLHAVKAAEQCPSLIGRQLHPHVLRHTAAMNLLHAGVDTTVIALWLGHADIRSTGAYLHADLAIKERALAKLDQPNTPTGRYHPSDRLLTFLESL